MATANDQCYKHWASKIICRWFAFVGVTLFEAFAVFEPRGSVKPHVEGFSQRLSNGSDRVCLRQPRL